MGFVTMGAGGLGVLVFGMIGPLSKRFDERWLLVVLGILPMLVGRALMFPISADHPPINCYNKPEFGVCSTECGVSTSTSVPTSSPAPFNTTVCWQGDTIVPCNSTIFANRSIQQRYHDLPVSQEEEADSLVSCFSGCAYTWCEDIPR